MNEYECELKTEFSHPYAIPI